jgi:hypothetical protein
VQVELPSAQKMSSWLFYLHNNKGENMNTEVFDQGTDERIPICKLQIEIFLSDHKDQSIIASNEVRDFLLDLYSELSK